MIIFSTYFAIAARYNGGSVLLWQNSCQSHVDTHGCYVTIVCCYASYLMNFFRNYSRTMDMNVRITALCFAIKM